MGERCHDLTTCPRPICVETRRQIAGRAEAAQQAARAATLRPRLVPRPAGRSRATRALGPPRGPLTVVSEPEPA